MLQCSKIWPIMLKNKNSAQYIRKTVILECTTDLPHVQSFNDYSIRIYLSFVATCHNVVHKEFKKTETLYNIATVFEIGTTT